MDAATMGDDRRDNQVLGVRLATPTPEELHEVIRLEIEEREASIASHKRRIRDLRLMLPRKSRAAK